MCTMSAQIFFTFWTTLFCVTSLPGDKMTAGATFGFAEATSNVIGGYVCKYVKDKHSFIGCCVLSLIS